MRNRLSLVLTLTVVLCVGILIGERLPLRTSVNSDLPLSLTPTIPAIRLTVEPSQQSRNTSLPSLSIKPGYFYQSFGGWDFRPYQSNRAVEYNPTTHAASMLGTGFDTMVLRLNLPQGAEIKEIAFFFIDNSPTEDCFMGLIRTAVDTGSDYSVEASASGAADLTLRSNSITRFLPPDSGEKLVIDNTQFSYYLQFNHEVENGRHGIVGARVGYIIPTDYSSYLLNTYAISW